MVNWKAISMEPKEAPAKPTLSRIEATTATDLWTLDYWLVSCFVDFCTVKLVEDLVFENWLQATESKVTQMNFVFLKMILCVDVVRNATERPLSFEATEDFVHSFCSLRLVVSVRNTNNKHFIRDKCQFIRCQLYLLCNFFRGWCGWNVAFEQVVASNQQNNNIIFFSFRDERIYISCLTTR